MKQWKRDLILGIAILTFCAVSYVYSYNLTDNSVKYFLARADTYVMIWLVLLALLAIMLIVRSLKQKPEEIPAPILTRRIFTTAIIIVAYVFMMDKLGFLISSFLFVFILLMFFTREEKGSLPRGKELSKILIIWIVIAVAAVALVQYLFGHLLGIKLPGGFLG